MNEQKISGRTVAWGLLVLAGAWFAKYCWDTKKMLDGVAEGKTEGDAGAVKMTKPKSEQRIVRLNGQFTVKLGETVFLKDEALWITFDGITNVSESVELYIEQRGENQVVGSRFFLPTSTEKIRTRRIETGDLLINQYIVQLLSLALPKTTGDIPEKNECVATLVVIRD